MMNPYNDTMMVTTRQEDPAMDERFAAYTREQVRREEKKERDRLVRRQLLNRIKGDVKALMGWQAPNLGLEPARQA